MHLVARPGSFHLRFLGPNGSYYERVIGETTTIDGGNKKTICFKEADFLNLRAICCKGGEVLYDPDTASFSQPEKAIIEITKVSMDNRDEQTIFSIYSRAVYTAVRCKIPCICCCGSKIRYRAEIVEVSPGTTENFLERSKEVAEVIVREFANLHAPKACRIPVSARCCLCYEEDLCPKEDFGVRITVPSYTPQVDLANLGRIHHARQPLLIEPSQDRMQDHQPSIEDGRGLRLT